MLSGEESVAIQWVVVLGFIRLATNRQVLRHPIAIDDAIPVVEGWFAQQPVVALNPGDEHWRVLARLLTEAGSTANLTTDAHLAALAIEHGAQLCSTDADCARFPHLRWLNPLA